MDSLALLVTATPIGSTPRSTSCLSLRSFLRYRACPPMVPAALLMSQAALAAAGYRPRSPTDALEAILENHLEEFLKGYDDRFRTTYGPMHPGSGIFSNRIFAAAIYISDFCGSSAVTQTVMTRLSGSCRSP